MLASDMRNEIDTRKVDLHSGSQHSRDLPDYHDQSNSLVKHLGNPNEKM